MTSSENTSLRHERHYAWLKDTANLTIANRGNCAPHAEFKHPGHCLQQPQYSRGAFQARRLSPSGQSVSDKSSPAEVFSPASSAGSSATSLSSGSTTADVSPTHSAASWASALLSVPDADTLPSQNAPAHSHCRHNGIQNKPHPRRTSVSSSWTRPSLLRQEQRRQYLVEQLVGKSIGEGIEKRVAIADTWTLLADSATHLVATIWPTATDPATFPNRIISLRFYIRETLRRSRTSYSTLQVTLWYLVLIRPFVVAASLLNGSNSKQSQEGSEPLANAPEADEPSDPLLCGRRMFLTALILASKYLQDRNFTARAWSKITGLAAKQIVSNESMFLAKIQWSLHMKEDDFKCWNSIILKCTDSVRLGHDLQGTWAQVLEWIEQRLDLQTVSENLAAFRQTGFGRSNLDTCNPAATLLTPTSSFTSPNEGSSAVDSTAAKSSPAMSIMSDSSASSFSFNEVRAPNTRFGTPSITRPARSNWGANDPRQLLTPSSSFSDRCDDDGQASHPSHTYLPVAQSDEKSTRDLRALFESLSNTPLVSTSQGSTDSQSGMRAHVQQPMSNPRYPTQKPASTGAGPQRGLMKRSIAHEAIKPPMSLNGLKRSASSMLTIPDVSEEDHSAKFRCIYGPSPSHVLGLAC